MLATENLKGTREARRRKEGVKYRSPPPPFIFKLFLPPE